MLQHFLCPQKTNESDNLTFVYGIYEAHSKMAIKIRIDHPRVTAHIPPPRYAPGDMQRPYKSHYQRNHIPNATRNTYIGTYCTSVIN